MDPRATITALFDSDSRDFAVELWDGTLLRGRSQPPGSRLVLRTPSLARTLAPPIDEDAVADAFARGEIDVVGDTIDVLESVARWPGPNLGVRKLPLAVRASAAGLVWRARSSVTGHTRARDARSVRRHYDHAGDFFRLFLDSSMTYSCAYFPRGDETLEEAQRKKLELVARKVGIGPGDRVLDIGCGWGSFIEYAAKSVGARAVGATVSESQYVSARERGVSVVKRDYRDLPNGPFDQIVSIGMMEHVGRTRLHEYFGAVWRRLRPGGRFLNHAIADIDEGQAVIPWLHRASGGFVQNHVFPDSDLVPLRLVVAAGERAGFEVRDVESLREHYQKTLSLWLSNLERRFDDAERLVGRETARRFRLYLAASAVAFALGKIGVYQVLFAKRTARGEAQALPRCRAAWYAGHG